MRAARWMALHHLTGDASTWRRLPVRRVIEHRTADDQKLAPTRTTGTRRNVTAGLAAFDEARNRRAAEQKTTADANAGQNLAGS